MRTKNVFESLVSNLNSNQNSNKIVSTENRKEKEKIKKNRKGLGEPN
jgi:hypothetical protein